MDQSNGQSHNSEADVPHAAALTHGDSASLQSTVAADVQVSHLETELAELSAAHATAVLAKDKLQQQLDGIRSAHELLQERLRQAQEAAAMRLKTAEEAAAYAKAEAARQLQEAEVRRASIESELVALRGLHEETEAELGRWRDIAGDFEARLVQKSDELGAALKQAGEVRACRKDNGCLEEYVD